MYETRPDNVAAVSDKFKRRSGKGLNNINRAIHIRPSASFFKLYNTLYYVRVRKIGRVLHYG